jgi:hypothetical protein
MQSSLAYRPSLPVASPIMPRAQSGLSGTTDAVYANVAPDTSAGVITGTEWATFVYGPGTITVGLRTDYGPVSGWAGTGNATYPLAYTVTNIGQSLLAAAACGAVSYGMLMKNQQVVSSGMSMNQQDGLSEPKHVDDAGLPIWEEIQAITARVPEDEWKSIPPDLASNVDKYLYRKDDER